MEAETLFAIFVADVRKADITPFESFITKRIGDELASEGLPPHLFGSLDARRVNVARTASRSVLGVMTEMTMAIRHSALERGGLRFCYADDLSRWLRRSLHRGPDYIVPLEVAAERAAAQAQSN